MFLVIHFYTVHLSDAHDKNDGKSRHEIWLALVIVLDFVYNGYFKYLFTNQGTTFTSNEWKQLNTLNDFKLSSSGVEAHSTLKTKKQHHCQGRQN